MRWKVSVVASFINMHSFNKTKAMFPEEFPLFSVERSIYSNSGVEGTKLIKMYEMQKHCDNI